MSSFASRLAARWDAGCFLCVGLDPDPRRLPAGLDVAAFCAAIVAATHDVACAFKPNAAFFEALGSDGTAILAATIASIRSTAPDVPIIYDAKRADIASSSAAYARAAFDVLGADAVTVHPYLGPQALQPFLERGEHGIFVLVRTSNPGGAALQDLPVLQDGRTRPLYQVLAEQVAREWNAHGNCGVVAGATYPAELGHVRRLVGDMPILVPGLATQGGTIADAVAHAQDARGRGMILSASRNILYASAGADFADAARQEALRLHGQITACRSAA